MALPRFKVFQGDSRSRELLLRTGKQPTDYDWCPLHDVEDAGGTPQQVAVAAVKRARLVGRGLVTVFRYTDTSVDRWQIVVDGDRTETP